MSNKDNYILSNNKRLELAPDGSPVVIQDSPGMKIEMAYPPGYDPQTKEISSNQTEAVIEQMYSDKISYDQAVQLVNQTPESIDPAYDIINVQQDTDNEVNNG